MRAVAHRATVRAAHDRATVRAALRACTLRLQLDCPRALATAPTPGASTLDAPFISDTMPLAEGIIGELGEVCVAVGDAVVENDVIAIIETGGPGFALARPPTSAATRPHLAGGQSPP